ncbi:ROK family transcriptional regulator [Arvimicrobium flavum]|uniref:ROK family transcriptional regulator n=1 Tax=Arvimicrobium flavum TaxID=3393320 RepID=UPI00237A0DDA|nr:ROK family transcriptional regulator [Mesorhizobium shangrilense]
MSMPRAVRHINEVRALDALFRGGPMSRADLARRLGLTRSTASSIVADLIEAGLVEEDDTEAAEREVVRTGRPGTDLRLNRHHAVFLGADIGVGHETAVAIGLDAAIVAEDTVILDMKRLTPEAVVDDLAGLVRRTMARLPAPEAVRGLSVVLPGLLTRDGRLMRAPILGWYDVPVLDMLRERLPELPTIVAENDANAFAMAELYRGGEAAPREALYIFMDAGVGGGLVSGGRILRGGQGYAGEIGHIYAGEEGFANIATVPGSLESFVGRDAVLARHRFHGGAAVSFGDFLRAVEAGEPSALSTVADWGRFLGRGLATLTSVLNPEVIVLGGPVASLFAYARDQVDHSLRKHLLANHPLPEIALSALGIEGPAIGAALMLHQSMFSIDEKLVFNRTQE